MISLNDSLNNYTLKQSFIIIIQWSIDFLLIKLKEDYKQWIISLHAFCSFKVKYKFYWS